MWSFTSLTPARILPHAAQPWGGSNLFGGVFKRCFFFWKLNTNNYSILLPRWQYRRSKTRRSCPMACRDRSWKKNILKKKKILTKISYIFFLLFTFFYLVVLNILSVTTEAKLFLTLYFEIPNIWNKRQRIVFVWICLFRIRACNLENKINIWFTHLFLWRELLF